MCVCVCVCACVGVCVCVPDASPARLCAKNVTLFPVTVELDTSWWSKISVVRNERFLKTESRFCELERHEKRCQSFDLETFPCRVLQALHIPVQGPEIGWWEGSPPQLSQRSTQKKLKIIRARGGFYFGVRTQP